MGRFGLFLLIVALTAVGTYVGSRIAGPAGAVIGAVSGVGVSAIGEAGRRRLDSLENRRDMRRRVLLPAVDENGHDLGFSPASMLVADRAIVPFIDREEELDELINWCNHWNADPLRLLVGVGGTGKTRLARELAARLSGWDCVWVRTGQEADALKAARRRKSLIVVEYAETKSRANLAKLLWDLAWPPGKQIVPSLIVARGIRGSSDDFSKKTNKRRVRVLLIARAVGDWWDELNEKAETSREQIILDNAKRTHLSTLTYDNQYFRRHYDEAIQAFSRQLKISPPTSTGADVPEDSPILVIHMAALVAILGFEKLPPDQQDKLLSRLLIHEERYWARSVESHGLASLSRVIRRQSVAELCLSGVISQVDAAELLKRVPHLAGATDAERSSVARWLQALFPGKMPGELGSLQPHLLAEYLVVRELANGDFFSEALSNLPEDRANHAFTILGQAAQRDPRASDMIQKAVEADRNKLILPAISAAVNTGTPLGPAFADILQGMSMDVSHLTKLSAAIPLESRSLNEAASVIRDKLAEAGITELRRLRKNAVGDKEIERRQALLIELARVYQFSQKNGRTLPASFRPELLKALGRQQRVLTGSGHISEARSISRRILQIEAPPSSASKL